MRISSLGTLWNSLWYCELYLLTVCAEGQGRVMSSSLADRPVCTVPAPPATPPPPATPALLAADTTLSLKGHELCTRLSTLAPYTHTQSRTSKAWSKLLQDTHCSLVPVSTELKWGTSSVRLPLPTHTYSTTELQQQHLSLQPLSSFSETTRLSFSVSNIPPVTLQLAAPSWHPPSPSLSFIHVHTLCPSSFWAAKKQNTHTPPYTGTPHYSHWKFFLSLLFPFPSPTCQFLLLSLVSVCDT